MNFFLGTKDDRFILTERDSDILYLCQLEFDRTCT